MPFPGTKTEGDRHITQNIKLKYYQARLGSPARNGKDTGGVACTGKPKILCAVKGSSPFFTTKPQ